jgi:hypothetical protein
MPPHRQPLSTCPCLRKLGLALCASIPLALPGEGARALDLDDGDEEFAHTPAYREGLKTWDNIKRYGAERIVDRSRKAFQPDGIRAGNYLIFPEVGSRSVFDDNIFAIPDNRVGDIRHELEPKIKFESHLPRHVLDFAIGGKLVSYLEHDEFDHIDGFASLKGALHFDHAHTLSANFLSAFEHEDLLEPLAPKNAAEQTPVWHNRAKLGARRDAGRLYGSMGFAVESWDYQDVKARDGSTVDQDLRDAAIYSTDLELGYRFSPGYELRTRFRALRQETRGEDDKDRDGCGYEGLAGLASEINPLLRWRLLGGYGVRDYDSPGTANAGASLLEAEIEWLPTQLMTVTGTARRRISDEVASEDAGGFIESALAAKLDYELARNLVFTVQGEYRDVDFNGDDRHDRYYMAKAGLDFYYTKNWLVSMSYEHQVRESNENENDLTRNRVWIGAKLRF